LENLFSGKINDPEAIQILEEKFRNYLRVHKPKVYEVKDESMNGSESLSDLLEAQACFSEGPSRLRRLVTEITDTSKMRKGDVLHIKTKDTECFIIYSGPNLNFSLQAVYFRNQNTEIINPIRYMDILGRTPVNYWESVGIPGLSFEFELRLVSDKISWKKVEIKTQNYLVGEFRYKGRDSYLMVPLDERSKVSAHKLSVMLQLANRTIFQTEDPKGVIEPHPSIFFADVSIYNPVDRDEDYENEYD
jgi:hypothetical protein